MVEDNIKGEVVLHHAGFFFLSKSEIVLWQTGFFSLQKWSHPYAWRLHLSILFLTLNFIFIWFYKFSILLNDTFYLIVSRLTKIQIK